MKNTLSEQIKKLQQQNGLPPYVKRKRDFPFVTEGEIEKGAIIYIPLSTEEGLIVKGGYQSSDKWIVIIGFSKDDIIVGSLLVNTHPNKFSKELGDIQFPLLPKDYEFLDYKSWLDCSGVFRISRSKIFKYGGYCGKMKNEDWKLIWETLRGTEFISDEEKEEFGIL